MTKNLIFMYYDMTQLPWWLIIFLSELVRSRVFQLAIKLVKIFDQKWKSNWKVQVNTSTTNTGRRNCKKKNRFISCHKFNCVNENSEFGDVCDDAIT